MKENPRKDRLRKRNEKIKNQFIKLSDKKTPGGAKLYRTDVILEKLADQFYLSTYTINDIVFSKSKE